MNNNLDYLTQPPIWLRSWDHFKTCADACRVLLRSEKFRANCKSGGQDIFYPAAGTSFPALTKSAFFVLLKSEKAFNMLSTNFARELFLARKSTARRAIHESFFKYLLNEFPNHVADRLAVGDARDPIQPGGQVAGIHLIHAFQHYMSAGSFSGHPGLGGGSVGGDFSSDSPVLLKSFYAQDDTDTTLFKVLFPGMLDAERKDAKDKLAVKILTNRNSRTPIPQFNKDAGSFLRGLHARSTSYTPIIRSPGGLSPRVRHRATPPPAVRDQIWWFGKKSEVPPGGAGHPSPANPTHVSRHITRLRSYLGLFSRYDSASERSLLHSATPKEFLCGRIFVHFEIIEKHTKFEKFQPNIFSDGFPDLWLCHSEPRRGRTVRLLSKGCPNGPDHLAGCDCAKEGLYEAVASLAEIVANSYDISILSVGYLGERNMSQNEAPSPEMIRRNAPAIGA